MDPLWQARRPAMFEFMRIKIMHGHVRVFGFQDTIWAQIGVDIDGESKGDKSGWSLALNEAGDVVIVGAPENDGSGVDAGHVRVYVSCNINYSVDSVVACQSLKWTNGKTYITNNNTATDTLISKCSSR
jgi:hypothetical protein